VLVTFGDEISEAMLTNVRRTMVGLRRERGITNLHPGYTSLLISFDPRLITHARVETLVRETEIAGIVLPEPARRSIPVCYGGDLGPDLGDVAAHCGLSTERVIELHSAPEYLVHFLGFSPGFPYLGGMPDVLAMPRLPNPRVRVPAGSVAIGGRQTGVYPLTSPGGWRIIGRTPLRLFTPDADPPALLGMGDRVRFIPISRADFDRHADRR
jgi:KipI family sensor histidine kinase inhibitor